MFALFSGSAPRHCPDLLRRRACARGLDSAPPICTLGGVASSGMNKAKAPKTPPVDAAARMTTAEATVGALIAHGIDTIYALPGVHNDSLFDALFKASDAIRTIHTRHEQGAAYLALGAALATGKPQVYSVVPGPGLLNSSAALLTAYGMNAIRDRPWTWTPARDSRSGGDHRPSGRFFRAHSRAGAGRRARRASAARDAHWPARAGRAGMRNRCLGPQRACVGSRADDVRVAGAD
jgi:Thiamine pyrophosphate enzyme, N-terminal TPP binding domain